jgi:organic hydroperoxide reductase OsmC/OhrA
VVVAAVIERYEAAVRWDGSLGEGYEAYSRTHSGVAGGATIGLTTGNEYGDPALTNPEQLVVLAAASCQLLWFLHLAAKARVEVVSYADEATAEMPDDVVPVALSRVDLRPRIVVAGEVSEARVLKLVELAHRECYVANSLRCPVEVAASVVVQANGGIEEEG